jgi:hypothetical protein
MPYLLKNSRFVKTSFFKEIRNKYTPDGKLGFQRISLNLVDSVKVSITLPEGSKTFIEAPRSLLGSQMVVPCLNGFGLTVRASRLMASSSKEEPQSWLARLTDHLDAQAVSSVVRLQSLL